ncbi:hypothetical protein HZB74_00560 [Candidatus Saccharibacteria bacterium]|nr:hypothetical protein [Candidatus Saccharibacteria bacterium]
MAIEDIEARPEREQTAIGKHYDDALNKFEGDFDEVVLAISTPEEALLLIMGRLEDLKENHGTHDATGLVICEIGNALSRIDDLEYRHQVRKDIWEDAFQAAKIRENPLHGWNSMRNAVHLFDSAGERLVLGD